MGMFTSPDKDSAAYPMQSLFVPFPFVCFTLALTTDLAYWLSGGNLMWQNFSSWLLFAGLVLGTIGLFAGLFDLARRRTRPLRPGFLATLLYIAALGIALANSFVHARDGWTAVVPLGLLLSSITFLVIVTAATVSARKYSRLAWRI